MNLKTSLLLVSFTLIALGVGLSIHKRSAIVANAGPDQNDWIPAFDLNAVSQVVIKTNADTTTLNNTPQGWTVLERDSYPADVTAIGDIVQRIRDFKPAQEVIAGPSQVADLELLEPDGTSSGTGTLIDLKAADGTRLAALVVGKQSFAQPDPNSPFPPSPNGRFIVVAGSEGPVGLAAEGFDLIRTKPDMWLDRGFVKTGRISSITLDAPNKKWRVSRVAPESPWILDGALTTESPDPSKIDPIAAILASPSFNDIAPATTGDTAFATSSTLTIESFDGLLATLLIGSRDGDSYPVKIALSANLRAERTPPQNEKAGIQSQDPRASLNAELEKGKKFANRIFKLPVQALEIVLKPRNHFLAPPQATPSSSQ